MLVHLHLLKFIKLGAVAVAETPESLGTWSANPRSESWTAAGRLKTWSAATRTETWTAGNRREIWTAPYRTDTQTRD